MGKDIRELLHVDNFLKVIEKVKGGVPGGILPDTMLNFTDRVIGDSGLYTKIESTRRVARAVRYGAPSVSSSLQGISKQPVKLIHAFEHFNHDPNMLALLKSMDEKTQERGMEIVGQQLSQFIQKFTNLRRAAWYSALTLGLIYFDGDGNLLYSSDGAKYTVDFGIPAGNLNQLDVLGTGEIIGAAWSVAGTAIATQITKLKAAAIKLTGYPITTAYYGPDVPANIAINDTMKLYLSQYPAAQQVVAGGQIPDGFCKLKWVDASSAFFEDASGVNRTFWANDMVVFTPDVADAGWWGLIEGSYNVPTDLGLVASDVLAALNSLQTIFGMFGYATVTNDPVGIRQFAGDTFLPVISVPKAIFIAKVNS